MYTVKEAFNMVYPMIGQHGVSYACGPNQFIHLINQALNMIYNYEGMHWSWQHRKDLFNMNERSQGALLSRWPVRKIDKFWGGNWKDVDKVGIDPCYCNLNLPDKVILPCCTCDCVAPCKPLDLMEILPQNKLCGGMYQISGGFVVGMGGLDQRIIKVDLGGTVIDDLWVTYFCGPVKMEKFSDVVPLPDSFMHVLAWIIAALVVPMYGVARQQEDLTYYSLYRKELDYLRKHDSIIPEDIEMPDNGINADLDGYPSTPFTYISTNQW